MANRSIQKRLLLKTATRDGINAVLTRSRSNDATIATALFPSANDSKTWRVEKAAGERENLLIVKHSPVTEKQ